MTPEATTRFLHVANGTSVTRTLEAAGIPGSRSIWADPLHEGPVPGALDDEELLHARMRYLTEPMDVTFAAWEGVDPSTDPVNDMRQWRAVIEQQEYDELILWFEHDLFDQLNLIQLLSCIRRRVSPTTPVSLVCIGSFPGRPDFKGLGELTPEELAPLLETRQRVSDRQYELAETAWRAFRESTPVALDRVRQADTSALPYLAPALARFLQDYPWTTDGLSRTERRLLELTDGSSISLTEAFPRMNRGEHEYYLTDTSLAALAERLSLTSPPLLTLDLAGAADEYCLRGAVTLTDTGRAVLAGRLDRVATCGIDRWFGGVHLEGRSGIWRWDDARQGVTIR